VQMLIGTAAYHASEVRRTGHTVASNLYNLRGYELLAGGRLFTATDRLDLCIIKATAPIRCERTRRSQAAGNIVYCVAVTIAYAAPFVLTIIE
jgi:hypothetical protein